MGAVHANNFTSELYLIKGPGQLRVSPVKYSDDSTEYQYEYWKVGAKPKRLISFRARPLPGCCGILVVYYVRPDGGRESWYSTMIAVFDAAKKAGYATLMLSLLQSSQEALEDLQKAGYILSKPMVNKKTGNPLVLAYIDLKQVVTTTKTFKVD
ncbi:MAG: hypothetical protein KGI27_10140 [Thaumarchaeota archaeon]|nr:hypothetical protein [Nitrososphaerota archaeon]